MFKKSQYTQVEVFHHVIAWAKTATENSYASLDQGDVMCYINDMYSHSQSVYDANHETDFNALLACNSCIVKIYARKIYPEFKGGVCATAYVVS